jgi:putative toxin-antitoxin system antitoxin component (TIGR02293 family)
MNVVTYEAAHLLQAPQTPFLERLATLLGIRGAFASELDLAKIAGEGLVVTVIDNLLREGLSKAELKFVIPPRTLAHRRAKLEPLSDAETDRAIRVAYLIAKAETTFGDKDKALRWLRRGLRRFDGKAALELMQTEAGAKLVDEALVQIDEGYSA